MISPKWFERAMIEKVGCDPALCTPEGQRRFWDHMQCVNGMVITEPYSPAGDAVLLAIKIARAINCRWHIELDSGWNPRKPGELNFTKK